MKRIFIVICLILSIVEISKANEKLDSIAQTGVTVMEEIKENTTADFFRDDVNLSVLISIIVAIASFVVGFVTFTAQNKTEKNTKKISQGTQRNLLNDILRHLYRNLIITYTMRTKLNDFEWNAYPSEEHFIKLRIPLENIHLDAFFGNDKEYMKAHNLYLNFRNYNEEVNVAMMHISNPHIDLATKQRDLGTLEFKVFYLTRRIIETQCDIWCKSNNTNSALKYIIKGQDDYVKRDIAKILDPVEMEKNDTSAKNNIPVEDSSKFEKWSEEKLNDTYYGEFLKGGKDIIGNDLKKILKPMVDKINKDIEEERMLNSRGEEKIHMIKF